ncbi:MAG TPA: hypothetical protein VKB71_17445 [Rhizomicrobium sp.]|nr:hypothetical protein [Rhizomicrobium sp.]
MSPLALSAIVFALVIASILIGTWLRRLLPQHHLDEDAKNIVRLGVALIATMAALVLSLLIAAANSSYDRQSNQVRQTTADIILIDNLMAAYGPDGVPIRKSMRSTIGPFVDRLWRENESAGPRPFVASVAAERADLGIRALAPQNELQRSLKERALQVIADLEQTRLLLFVESGNTIPMPFLAVLTIWLMIIFASYSLFTSLNVTTFTILSLFALSAAAAIFLILELNSPFSGLMTIPSAPLHNALAPLRA